MAHENRKEALLKKHGLSGVNKATQWVPENEKARSVLEKIRNPKPLSTDPLEDAAMQSNKRRSDALDELG